ncbi:hypothetical protein ACOMHN_049121 [Nucella lapillus]
MIPVMLRGHALLTCTAHLHCSPALLTCTAHLPPAPAPPCTTLSRLAGTPRHDHRHPWASVQCLCLFSLCAVWCVVCGANG